MAPDFEIFEKIGIMRMISFFLPDLRLIEDCCARWLGDDPYPEIEDVHSSRIEDCEPMRQVSLYVRRLHQIRLEEYQVWLEEGQSPPETGYPT